MTCWSLVKLLRIDATLAKSPKRQWLKNDFSNTEYNINAVVMIPGAYLYGLNVVAPIIAYHISNLEDHARHITAVFDMLRIQKSFWKLCECRFNNIQSRCHSHTAYSEGNGLT